MHIERISGNVSLDFQKYIKYHISHHLLQKNIYIPVAMNENGLEHVREHVLDFFHVFFKLSSFGKKVLEAITDTLVADLVPLSIVLTLRVVKIDGDSQSNVDECSHQLHR